MAAAVTDRLAEITRRFHAGEVLAQEDIGWLIAEVTIKRGLLARLEWASSPWWPEAACPACDVPYGSPHESGCWLAAELNISRSG